MKLKNSFKMKYFLLLALFCCLIVGCKSSSTGLDPTPPVVLKPEIKVFSVDKLNLVFAETTTVTWQVLNAQSCSLAGKSIDIAGSLTTSMLVKDTILTITATGNGGSASSSLTIKVGNWTTSKIGLLVGKTWGGLKSEKIFTNGVFVAEPNLADGQKNNPVKFELNGNMIYANNIIGTGKWSLSGSILAIGLAQFKLVSLTEIELVYNEELIYNNLPSICEYTFWR